ncbi:MAG: hypothetical protein IPL08_17015 [Saprospiraceae bacterium]|nr:hypothetical protein [Saprospiraceae bacterium]MBK8670543.1 hypothetical protein [Saprospiraceae bacterium]MBL0102149.1 hypothetical protein [Saprospiraceae bacterium]
MLEHFNILSEEEKVVLTDAVPLIAVLIAGADGKFEPEELDWADKVTHIRTYKMKGDMQEFYREVDKTFMEKLNYFMDSLPAGVEERNRVISERLSGINHIMAKIDPATGAKLYKSFVSFAEHIAKASGGVMGFFSVSKEEANLVSLPMITPVIFKDDE